MKTSLLSVTSLWVLSIGFTGCGVQEIQVPKEQVNIDDYTKNKINRNNNSDLFIYINGQAGIQPPNVKIDNVILQGMSAYTYSYHELEKGYHWIAVSGLENDSYICKNFSNDKEILNIYRGMGLQHERYFLEEKQDTSDFDKDSKQIKQSKKFLKTFNSTNIINQIKIISDSKNEKIINLITNLEKKMSNNGSAKTDNNNLTLKISLMSSKDGNMFGRWMFGGMDMAKDYADVLSIKTEIIYNNELVDTLYSSRILTGGIFGGSTAGMLNDISDEITSYVMCKFYQKQYPLKVIQE